LIRIRISCS